MPSFLAKKPELVVPAEIEVFVESVDDEDLLTLRIIWKGLPKVWRNITGCTKDDVVRRMEDGQWNIEVRPGKHLLLLRVGLTAEFEPV